MHCPDIKVVSLYRVHIQTSITVQSLTADTMCRAVSLQYLSLYLDFIVSYCSVDPINRL